MGRIPTYSAGTTTPPSLAAGSAHRGAPLLVLPCFALSSGRELWIVETESDASDEVAMLHKFHALNTSRIPPELVRSFRLDCRDGSVAEFGANLNISAGLAGIRADADAMLRMIRPDGSIAEEDFPADTTRCANCPFTGSCAAFFVRHALKTNPGEAIL
ncbi:MAG: hypothetical protein L6W00_24255 [Lentisphaeria bacterium]|nr:MAG: hypothetical protein L6W00_24255 [Lentisphaeria bacterium]